MPTETTLKKPVHPAAVAAIGFLIGVFLTSAWFVESRLGSSIEKPVATVPVATTGSTTQNTSAGLVSVHDQSSGSTVTVDSVNIPSPGVWVAVEEVNDTQLGNVLGAARALGPSTNVVVPLLRNTVPETTYAVVLYRDNGDGIFDQETDSVYVDFTTGQRVVALFKTLL